MGGKKKCIKLEDRDIFISRESDFSFSFVLSLFSSYVGGGVQTRGLAN